MFQMKLLRPFSGQKLIFNEVHFSY